MREQPPRAVEATYDLGFSSCRPVRRSSLVDGRETSFGELHARIDDVERRRPLVDVLLTQPEARLIQIPRGVVEFRLIDSCLATDRQGAFELAGQSVRSSEALHRLSANAWRR
jgi:hypothetical protein